MCLQRWKAVVVSLLLHGINSFPFVLNAVLQDTELCLGCFNAMNVMSFNNPSNLFAHNLFF